MVFTTAAFIRRNTPELRKKLEEFGYYKNSPKWTDNCSIIWAYQYPEKGFDTPNYVIADSFDIPFDKHSRLCGKFIDCGINENLFLATASSFPLIEKVCVCTLSMIHLLLFKVFN